MARPRCFVGSSAEALEVAKAVQEALEGDAEVTIWNQDVFQLSDYAVDSLITGLRSVDFGVFVFAPDDIVKIRGAEYQAARDNVILELGLSMGVLGRRRSFVLVPRSDPDLRIPTDLLGLTVGVYDAGRSDRNLVAGVGVACNRIARVMKRLGRLEPSVPPEVEDPRGAVLDGISRLAQTIADAYGPLGHTVSLEDVGRQFFTRSGSRIATGATSPDRLSRHGMKALGRAARDMHRQIGDGTKLAVILAARMLEEASNALEAGFASDDVIGGMRESIAKVNASIVTQAVPANPDRLLSVAKAAAFDDQIALAVVDATEKAGAEGVITVELAANRGDVVAELSEGMTLERGYAHSDFAVGSANDAVVLEKCLVVLFDGRATYASDVVPLLQLAKDRAQPLVIVADDIDSEALETLLLNHRGAVVRCVAVKAPGFGDSRSSILKDIASFTGARLIERALGRSLAHLSPVDVGSAEHVRVKRDQTTLVGGGGTSEEVERRAGEIRTEIEYATDDYQRAKAQERLGRLRGRIVTLRVGGATGASRAERQELTASAMFAVQAAIESGIVTGGGVSLMKARNGLDSASEVAAGRRMGVRAVMRALEEPVRVLAKSAGEDEATVVATVERGLNDNVGLNVRTRRLEALDAAGVTDPSSVIRIATGIAFETARAVLTTESWEADTDERSGQ